MTKRIDREAHFAFFVSTTERSPGRELGEGIGIGRQTIAAIEAASRIAQGSSMRVAGSGTD